MSPSNLAASVRQRLLNRAKERGDDFQLVLTWYGIERLLYPSLLDLPPPRLRAYPREVVVAEKLQALVQLGMANTRMKDFYDLWTLARQFDFEGKRLAQAIAATFERRSTPIPAEAPLALTSEFHGDAAKQTQWRAFLRRGSVAEAAELAPVVELIAAFVMPPAEAARAGDAFASRWQKGGPWKRGSG